MEKKLEKAEKKLKEAEKKQLLNTKSKDTKNRNFIIAIAVATILFVFIGFLFSSSSKKTESQKNTTFYEYKTPTDINPTADDCRRACARFFRYGSTDYNDCVYYCTHD